MRLKISYNFILFLIIAWSFVYFTTKRYSYAQIVNRIGEANSSNSGSIFNSGVIPSNSIFQQTFNKPGQYPYHCIIHPAMSGIVTTSDAFKEETILKWLQEQDRLLTFQKTLEPCFALKPKQYSWIGLHHLHIMLPC